MAEEKNKKGLGRGLMSLFGDQVSEQAVNQRLLKPRICQYL